jgi:hypothetical protein
MNRLCGVRGPRNGYVRCQAYLQMGSGAEAASEFQKILNHPESKCSFHGTLWRCLAWRVPMR